MTSGKLIMRNVFWNFAGHGAPFIVAVFAIPPLIDGLGVARFGILSMAWVMVGYFGVFDIGLGRALTKLVAERLNSPLQADIPPLVWTGLLLMLLLGVIGAIGVWLMCPWLVYEALGIPESLRVETLYAFYTLALSVPFLVGTAGLRGILEAQQRFGVVTAIRIPMGVVTFLGPLLVLPFSSSLFPITMVLVAARVIAWVAHLWVCLSVMPALRRFSITTRVVKPLLHFGGWMTVTNIVSPVMVYFDRFLISMLISVTAVAYYVTPLEMVTKLLIVPAAVVGVLFPAFSMSLFQEPQRVAKLYYRGMKYVFLLLCPVILIIVAFATEILTLWLGADFAENSSRVLQIIAVGVLINAVANVPFALVQGAGRPDITAKLNAVELPCYLMILWWLIHYYGIHGAAVAWLLRMAIDAGVLLAVARRLLPPVSNQYDGLVPPAILILVTLVVGLLPSPITVKVALIVFTGAAYVWITWVLLLDAEERAVLSDKIPILRHVARTK